MLIIKVSKINQIISSASESSTSIETKSTKRKWDWKRMCMLATNGWLTDFVLSDYSLQYKLDARVRGNIARPHNLAVLIQGSETVLLKLGEAKKRSSNRLDIVISRATLRFFLPRNSLCVLRNQNPLACQKLEIKISLSFSYSLLVTCPLKK